MMRGRYIWGNKDESCGALTEPKAKKLERETRYNNDAQEVFIWKIVWCGKHCLVYVCHTCKEVGSWWFCGRLCWTTVPVELWYRGISGDMKPDLLLSLTTCVDEFIGEQTWSTPYFLVERGEYNKDIQNLWGIIGELLIYIKPALVKTTLTVFTPNVSFVGGRNTTA